MLAQFNVNESTVTFTASSVCKPLSPARVSAIDAFYGARDATIMWAFKAPFDTNSTLRPNLLLVVFSAAETYFRRTIAEVLAICPIAAEFAAQQQVAYGAISALGKENLGFTISDTKGFTSSGEIGARTKNLLGVAIDKSSSLGVAIDQFERISNFRHSIAHSSGEILYSNRRDLQITDVGRLVVELDDKAFQDIVQIVVNAVRAYNNHVANLILQRWFIQGHMTGDWASDKAAFGDFSRLFFSEVDSLPAGRPYDVYLRSRKLMKKAQTKQ